MKLSYKALALADLDEIRRFIRKRNPERALSFTEELVKRCQQVADRPGLGRSRPDLENEERSGIRSFAYKTYIILYQVEPDRVSIRRIVHGARDLTRLAM